MTAVKSMDSRSPTSTTLTFLDFDNGVGVYLAPTIQQLVARRH
jgi:hypothetical protein